MWESLITNTMYANKWIGSTVGAAWTSPAIGTVIHLSHDSSPSHVTNKLVGVVVTLMPNWTRNLITTNLTLMMLIALGLHVSR